MMRADKAGQMRKFRVKFSGKELNYLWMGLMERVRGLEEGPLRDAGNVPHIRRFSRKLANKIWKVHHEPWAKLVKREADNTKGGSGR